MEGVVVSNASAYVGSNPQQVLFMFPVREAMHHLYTWLLLCWWTPSNGYKTCLSNRADHFQAGLGGWLELVFGQLVASYAGARSGPCWS